MKNKSNLRLLFLIALFVTQLAATAQNTSTFEVTKNMDVFSTLYKQLNQNYVDDLNHGQLIKSGIDGMLQTLDPYTVFITEEEVEDYNFITTGQYGGIGALIQKQGDYVVISEPYENSPAVKAGLIAGDKILKINDADAKGKSVNDVSLILKGQPGTTLRLLIERADNNQPMAVEIKRETVAIPSVAYSTMLENGTGYIKLTSFTQTSGQEVKTAFNNLKETGKLKGVILDLRDNGGGLLNEAVNISNIFVDKGELIVSTKGKTPDRNRSYKTLTTPIDTKIPVVVLVNGRSASASEIVAGALQDIDRAVIMGEKTFGKGLVQNILPLSYNTQMKVTVAKYYIPSGRCIQAIDYATHDSLGRPQRIPDSLVHAYKTRAGRTVYDGGGVIPDVPIESKSISNVSVALLSQFMIFDYANKFKRENKSIAAPAEFVITDAMYNDFTRWVKDRKFTYSTRSEAMLDAMKEIAEHENYYQDLKNDFDHLEARIAENKSEDLIKNKEEIKSLLRSEIVTRYYNQKGRIEASLTEDHQVKAAADLLGKESEVTNILKTKSNTRI